MSSYICCYNENRELEHFKVPKPISVYIRQLECEIKYGRGGVQKLYPGRFNQTKPFDKEDFDYQTYIEDYK
jgi:hypothetical protein